jgi:flagellar hook protein FlgE
MIGFFDNGLTLELARVAIATFNNRAGLVQNDGGLYLATAASGPASIDGEGTGGRGSVLSGSLETSNVDIAEEFTALIVFQRGYQSNSRIITTADQLLQEALNLKR